MARINKVNPDRAKGENAVSESESYKAGLAVRKKVLGEKYVNDSLAQADDFTAPFQQFVTEHAWGAVWTREGLSLKTRSMLNLAILTAINRPHELRLHIRGALNNGVTKEEMREIFLQSAVYCGAPAALDAFKVAKQLFAEDAAAPAKG
jgi:Uncharacterized homolog of gamma-carboxymuconolac tone decarboxylase subunit